MKKNVYDYAVQWLDIIASGGEVPGHGFFAGFPDKFKAKYQSQDRLYYALSLIQEYAKNKTGFEWVKTGSQPPMTIPTEDKTLWWNLYSALKDFEFKALTNP
jgi:hypothetical protein